MTWDNAVTALEAILSTVGTANALTPLAGEQAVPPRDCITWFYGGPVDNPLIPETLTDHPFGELVTIRAYWVVGDRSKSNARALELKVRAVARALVAALEADRSLNESCEAVVIEDGSTGWQVSDANQWTRVLTVPINVGFTDSEPISR